MSALTCASGGIISSLKVECGEDYACSLSWSKEGGVANRRGAIERWSEHHGPVKALAWCPWQPKTRGNHASGGCTNDRRISLWNVNRGSCMSAVDTVADKTVCLWKSFDLDPVQKKQREDGHINQQLPSSVN
ncbi:hypothetical protein D4764_16G0007810 [Takifugu flavidus]|uniref:Cell division cycle protein 20-like protein B n=1 Tax=Takifugu flavidus TaxID=433684 RepID=A0A5C6NXQ3_9TELE|nr:hypothetical protein D4764_16G0007810 [Takifugu flavidus]